MRRLAPLVTRLSVVALVALVALAVAEEGSDATAAGSVAAVTRAATTPTVMTARPVTSRPRRQRTRTRKRTTTTTTTTAEPEDDDYDTTAISTTTVDPRTFDHTDTGTCGVPLGMESGRIGNDSLSASSSYDQSVSPLSSRIRKEIRGGAWCPNGLISANSREYLELDLQNEYLVTATESQGRFANSVGVEFVQFYSVEYWRPALKRWAKYKDFNGTRLIPGNHNTYTPRKTTLDAPFIASKVRFFPYAAHPRTTCMRVELYGCRWKQALVTYSEPKGNDMQAMTGGALFKDLSYDGVVRDGRLVNGLGQMTDSLTGPNDFELEDPDDTTGTRWVGWNKTINEEVILTFNFSTPRIVNSVDLHCNNMFTKDVQLFKEAEVYFSLEGERWQDDCVSHEPKQDRVSEHARVVRIDLQNRTAQHVKIKLKFQHEWILLSEITFKSVETSINSTNEFFEEYYRLDSPYSSKKKRFSSLKISIYIGVGLVGGGVCITIIIYLVKIAPGRIPDIHSFACCPSLRNNHNNNNLNNVNNNRGNRKSPRLALGLSTCSPMLRPSVVDEDYREPYNIWRETLGRRDKLEFHDQNEYNEICEDPEFPMPYMMRRPDPAENYYAATDIIHHSYSEHSYRRHESPQPGLFTSIKLPEAEPPNGVAPLLDFPRGRMRPVTFLGEGPHGTLQICETDGIEELINDDVPTGSRRRRRLVIVKTLWRNAHNDIKAAFTREATWGAGLKHPQLARVLGLSLVEPPCAALDRGDAAHLPIVLRQNPKLSYSSLIHICCQIAAGMKYLESFELVHRDLSARNVTLNEELTVKVADYAMFCEQFEGEYHVQADGSRLPLRWMAWETLLMDMFSPASDVWSFGVTVWEILTFCTAKPYEEMTDEQVMTNASKWRGGGRARGARVPAAPLPRCRRELYDLMHECWHREPSQRPRFHDIHRFLGRMSYGYRPPPPPPDRRQLAQ